MVVMLANLRVPIRDQPRPLAIRVFSILNNEPVEVDVIV